MPRAERTPAPAAQRPAQQFVASYAAQSAFERGGLRDYFAYRDLGLRAGTHGLVQAHVLRAAQPCPPDGTGWHTHEVDFQMIYVLQGQVRTEIEGQGLLTFNAGDSWLQPPGIRHCVRDYSPDLQLLEIVSPADFGTTDVDGA